MLRKENVGNNIIDLIGNTPLVKINKLNPNPNTIIYAKLEGNNPGGSIKDRIALKMIEQAETEGELVKGKTIIEATSGNTGISLAMIGVSKGYNVEIVMSEAVSVERRKMIKAFGGNVILTPAEKGTDGAILKVKELRKNILINIFAQINLQIITIKWHIMRQQHARYLIKQAEKSIILSQQ